MRPNVEQLEPRACAGALPQAESPPPGYVAGPAEVVSLEFAEFIPPADTCAIWNPGNPPPWFLPGNEVLTCAEFPAFCDSSLWEIVPLQEWEMDWGVMQESFEAALAETDAALTLATRTEAAVDEVGDCKEPGDGGECAPAPTAAELRERFRALEGSAHRRFAALTTEMRELKAELERLKSGAGTAREIATADVALSKTRALAVEVSLSNIAFRAVAEAPDDQIHLKALQALGKARERYHELWPKLEEASRLVALGGTLPEITERESRHRELSARFSEAVERHADIAYAIWPHLAPPNGGP